MLGRPPEHRVRVERIGRINIGCGSRSIRASRHRAASAKFTLDAAPPGERGYGLTVVVNHRLSYRFDIHDFEEEVSVARVDLAMGERGPESRFVLVADSSDGWAGDPRARPRRRRAGRPGDRAADRALDLPRSGARGRLPVAAELQLDARDAVAGWR